MKKDNVLDGKLAVVTGAAGGIGYEFAVSLAGRGCDLLLIDINAGNLEKSQASIRNRCKRSGIRIYTLVLDLTSRHISDELDRFCAYNNLEPDILINNAGIFSFLPITETSEKTIDIFVDLHVRAVTVLSQWFVKRRKPLGSGHLLNMSSMSCWMPMPGLAMYSSTKSYIRVFSRSLYYELRDYGVSVTVACPGGIATDLFGLPKKWQRFAVAIGVLASPGKFADKAVEKMLRGKKQYINGLLNRFSIFFVGILPTRARMAVKHRLLDKGITR